MDVKKLYEWANAHYGKTTKDTEEWKEIWEHYMKAKQEEYEEYTVQEALPHLLSEWNYRSRKSAMCASDMGVYVRNGDICFVDFGEAYIQEIGYQHFALVVSTFRNKMLVIPMSGNTTMYQQLVKGEIVRPHLYPFEKIVGMKKDAILFLNDAKFINSARVIDVKAHLPVKSEKFKEIKKQLFACVE